MGTRSCPQRGGPPRYWDRQELATPLSPGVVGERASRGYVPVAPDRGVWAATPSSGAAGSRRAISGRSRAEAGRPQRGFRAHGRAYGNPRVAPQCGSSRNPTNGSRVGILPVGPQSFVRRSRRRSRDVCAACTRTGREASPATTAGPVPDGRPGVHQRSTPPLVGDLRPEAIRRLEDLVDGAQLAISRSNSSTARDRRSSTPSPTRVSTSTFAPTGATSSNLTGR